MRLDDATIDQIVDAVVGRVKGRVATNASLVSPPGGARGLAVTGATGTIARSGDDGLMLVERAPFGVICSITPCTNPTETIINNGIGMVAGGNSVLFNVHPTAKETSAWYVALLNDAIVAAGGPECLLNC